MILPALTRVHLRSGYHHDHGDDHHHHHRHHDDDDGRDDDQDNVLCAVARLTHPWQWAHSD